MRRLLLLLSFWPLAAAAGEAAPASARRPIKIAVSAEFGHATSTSAEAVRRGAVVAIDELNAAGGLLGRPIELVVQDDRSIPSRAVENVEALAADPDVVAVLTGKHSPVVEELVPAVHRHRLPLVAPWSASDAIVDNGHSPNFVFRVSLNDTWGMEALVASAERRGLRRLGIILPNTGWGRSALRATERRVARGKGTSLVATTWYNTGDTTLLPLYGAVLDAHADAVLLVANEGEGAILVREVAALSPAQRRPILSHWGITGGQFARSAGAALRQVDLTVVQTYSFVGARGPAADRVLRRLRERFGVPGAREVESPVGVAHAYDAVHLVARAIRKAGSTDRSAIRDALERLGPYEGLVRTYRPPFTTARHEALGPEDVFLARFDEDGVLVPGEGRR